MDTEAEGISVLLVDDETTFRKTLRTALSAGGYSVEEATTGEEALAAVREGHFHVVLLDMNLPGLTGIDICRQIRKLAPVTGIVMVTVRDSEDDTVCALEAGADDYLTKPVRFGELTARLAAVVRRTQARAGRKHDVLRAGELRMDLDNRAFWKGTTRIRLSPTEFELLSLLMNNEGVALTHVAMLSAIWGPDHRGDVEYLRAYIRLLRKKIEDDPARPAYILTEPWVGYRFRNPGVKDRCQGDK